MIVPEI